MQIYSMSCDLQSKRIVWTNRSADDSMTNWGQMGLSSSAVATTYSKFFASEAISKLPNFED